MKQSSKKFWLTVAVMFAIAFRWRLGRAQWGDAALDGLVLAFCLYRLWVALGRPWG